MEASDVTDEMLTAFLDGEVDTATSECISDLVRKDPALAARLEALQIPMEAIRSAFELAAKATPTDELAAVFDGPAPSHGDEDQPLRHRWGRQFAVAASILALAVGVWAGRMTIGPVSDQDWRVAVAEYQALYSRDTLSVIDAGAADNDDTVRWVAEKVGAPIEPHILVNLDRLTFKRAQILRWQDAPLAQFAFLSDRNEPIAFCATPTSDADRPTESNLFKGLASSSWVEDGVAYMVIGGRDQGFVTDLAERLSQQL